MIKLSHIGSLSILTLTAVFAYSGCASVDTDEDATSDEESIGESESELGTADLEAANACVKAINDYRVSHGKAKATNLNSTLTSTPVVSGTTYGDCAQKDAKYDSINGAHASLNYSQLGKNQCRAFAQNECLNRGPKAWTKTQFAQACVSNWTYGEENAADKPHLNNVMNYGKVACAVYKNAAGQVTTTANFGLQ